MQCVRIRAVATIGEGYPHKVSATTNLQINDDLLTEERQKGRHLRVCPMPQGFEAPKFIYEKQKKDVFRSGVAQEIRRPF